MAAIPRKKGPPNLQRATPGPWNGTPETFNTAEPIKGVPKKGWCLVNGKNSAQSNLYYDGRPIEHVAALTFEATATSMTILTIKVVLPDLTVITRKDDD